MQVVNSSTIESIDYLDSRHTLVISFKRSGKYEYFNVPKYIYDALITAPSKGIYLNKYIKGKYIVEKA